MLAHLTEVTARGNHWSRSASVGTSGGNQPCRLPGRIPRDDRLAYRLPLAKREVGVACVSLLMQTNESTYHKISIDRPNCVSAPAKLHIFLLANKFDLKLHAVPSLLLWQPSNPKLDFVEIHLILMSVQRVIVY